MTSNSIPAFVVLAILDGWGIAPDGPGNAISQAKTPKMDRFWHSYPHTQLIASGNAVGLPKGECGNTETGHLNLGAGRIVYQDLERINMAIADGSFFNNEILLGAIEHIKKNNSKLHLMGLVGAGGVHSSLEHLAALIRLTSLNKITKVFLHIFTDGRDSPPRSAKVYIRRIEDFIKKYQAGNIASIMGRFWAMDRDQRWDRTKRAYFALIKGEGRLAKTPEEAIDSSYSEEVTDEFIEPFLITQSSKPEGLIEKNDAVVFFNFRIDRPRQLSKAFVFEDFKKATVSFDFDPYLIKYGKTHIQKVKDTTISPFERGPKLENLYFVTMTEYSQPLVKAGAKAAFPPTHVDMPIGRVIAAENLKQLRITESEKERFVTYYFNGLREEPFLLEERIIIPSPLVPTYDKKPEMSAFKLTDTLISKLRTEGYKFIVVNYPNPDMVGHTGKIKPAIKAIEVVDGCIGKLAECVMSFDGALIITADHGNAEEMIDPQTGGENTEHSSNPVPFIVISKKFMSHSRMLKSGILADVAPSILALMDLTIPGTMLGRNLLKEMGIG